MTQTLIYKKIRVCSPVQFVSLSFHLGERAIGGFAGRLSDPTGVAVQCSMV